MVLSPLSILYGFFSIFNCVANVSPADWLPKLKLPDPKNNPRSTVSPADWLPKLKLPDPKNNPRSTVSPADWLPKLKQPQIYHL